MHIEFSPFSCDDLPVYQFERSELRQAVDLAFDQACESLDPLIANRIVHRRGEIIADLLFSLCTGTGTVSRSNGDLFITEEGQVRLDDLLRPVMSSVILSIPVSSVPSLVAGASYDESDRQNDGNYVCGSKANPLR